MLFRSPVRRNGIGAVPEALVVCTSPAGQARTMIAERHPMYAGFGAEVEVVELPTSHWPMFSRPAELAGVLGELAT